MKLLACICLGAMLFLQDIPYKTSNEFEIRLDYQFKNREAADRNRIELNETRAEHERRTSTAVLPYLVLHVKLLKLSEEEVKIKITDNFGKTVGTKKITTGTVIPLDVGFTDDVKDRVSAHQYNMTLISPDKKFTSRIVVHIEEDGTFIVNGERRGKF
jgi:hypothetical protein